MRCSDNRVEDQVNGSGNNNSGDSDDIDDDIIVMQVLRLVTIGDTTHNELFFHLQGNSGHSW
jgi:hypothetical protein